MVRKFLSVVFLVVLQFFFGIPLLANAKDSESSLKQIRFSEEEFYLVFRARDFIQGEVVQVEILPVQKRIAPENIRLLVDGNEIALSGKNGRILGFIPIHPERDHHPLETEIYIQGLFLRDAVKKFQIPVGAANFPVIRQSIRLDQKYTQKEYDSKTLAFIQECSKARSEALSIVSPLQIDKGFVDPVKVVSFSSPFYIRREYNDVKGKPHGGVDYRGKEGTPVFAINRGTVVLAKDMFFEGKFTIIDHGNRIFSMYMHQSKILVKPGQVVERGEKIGEIGSTGMSTGPHLHLGVKVDGVLVHPLSLLAFREI